MGMKIKRWDTRMMIAIGAVALAIGVGFWWNYHLEQRYQNRLTKATEVAREFALEKCKESKFKDECGNLKIYPPGDWAPIGYDQAWSFVVETNTDKPEEGFWYNIVVTRSREDSYRIHAFKEISQE